MERPSVTDLLFGNQPDDDEADDYSATSEDEGDDLVPLDELAALASPEDELSEDGDDGADLGATDQDEVDRLAELQAERDRLIAERDQTIQERDRFAQERQLQAIQNAQNAWRQEEQAVYQQASQMPDWDRASAHLVGFYRNQIQQITQAAQQLIGQAYQGQWLDQVAQSTGLTAEDRAILAGLPADRVPQIAQALAAKNNALNQRLSQIEAEQQQLKRGRQAQRRQLTGADRTSGSRGAPPPRQRYQDGSTDQVLDILRAQRAIREQRRAS